MIRSSFLLAPALSVLLLNATVNADPAWQEPPVNPVILTVNGEMQCCPNGTVYLDLERLDALPQTTINTITPWTESVHSFTGVRLNELLETLGVKGTQLEAVALNDYSTIFSTAVSSKYPVILATRRDGQLMRVRDKGPIWIIYPLSDYPELRKEQHHHAMVWQLKALTVGR